MRLQVPKFDAEAEEAQWWFEHQEELVSEFQAAAERGDLSMPGEGRVARLLRERTALRAGQDSIRADFAPGDLNLANDLARERNLPCEAVLRELARRTLALEHKRQEQVQVAYHRFLGENDPVLKHEAGQELMRQIFGRDAIAEGPVR